MSLREILDEIELTKARILEAAPGSIVHSDLILALYVLQDMAIKAYAIGKAA